MNPRWPIRHSKLCGLLLIRFHGSPDLGIKELGDQIHIIILTLSTILGYVLNTHKSMGSLQSAGTRPAADFFFCV